MPLGTPVARAASIVSKAGNHSRRKASHCCGPVMTTPGRLAQNGLSDGGRSNGRDFGGGPCRPTERRVNRKVTIIELPDVLKRAHEDSLKVALFVFIPNALGYGAVTASAPNGHEPGSGTRYADEQN